MPTDAGAESKGCLGQSLSRAKDADDPPKPIRMHTPMIGSVAYRSLTGG